MRKNFVIGLVSFLILFGAAIIVKEVSAMFSEEDWEKEPTVILQCNGYGYNVKALINGMATNIKGGKSESRRLFYKTSKLAKEAPAEMKKYFLFNEGENQIQAEFEKTGEIFGLTLYVWLESEPMPSFLLYSKDKAKDKLDKKFIIKSPLPKDFKPVVITDAGENKAVMVVVANPAVVNAALNGKKGPTVGMLVPIVLENVKPGKNDLSVTYQADPSKTKEIRIAVATPEWLKVISKKVTSKAARTEKFTFNAK